MWRKPEHCSHPSTVARQKMAGPGWVTTAVLLLLCWGTHQTDGQAPTVSISVTGSPPPGFTPGPNEYRAASGPFIFTCTATGGAGTGNYQYVWTTTCTIPTCVFDTSFSGTTSVITRMGLHSGDGGTHTCTATRNGMSGSDTITINIVGVGIAVFTPSTGAQPNNGLVISTNPGSGRRFFFECRSNSLTVGVGDFIGLDGSRIVEDTDFFRFRDTDRGGEISIENAVGTETLLPASEQGVYTCRMPFEGGGEGEFNIGVYPNGFNTIPSISNPLIFTPGSPSSTLTCTSTTSVATTVTFMRDTTTVGPLRDGESMDFGGVTYQLVQTVTNRAESTYQNVLTINQPLASIVGSSFTCSVQNTVGTSPTSAALEIMAACDPNPCQNGGTCMTDGSGSFTCNCIAGYTGGLCDVNIDDCEPDPCLNGGTCNDEVGGFMCDCISGFTGETCDVNINDCEPDPCLNGGTCNDEVDGFMCDCISGFTGETCDTEVDDGSQDMFQIQFGPVEHCVSWNSEKATSLENAIHSASISVLGDHCQCMFPSSNIDSGHFTCLTTPMQATYRSTIFGIVGNNATHLLSVLQDWVATGPVIKLGWMLLHVSPDCPIHIASMADPECSPSEPLTFDNPTLITSDSEVIQCVNVCLLRTRGRSICGI